MLYAGIDIHKSVFHAVVLDPETGELTESRFEPTRDELGDWAMRWQGKLAALAIEATTAWGSETVSASAGSVGHQ